MMTPEEAERAEAWIKASEEHAIAVILEEGRSKGCRCNPEISLRWVMGVVFGAGVEPICLVGVQHHETCLVGRSN